MTSGLAGLAERAIQQCVPLQVLFELTDRCPLDCVHCYLARRVAQHDELDLAEISRILAELRAAGAFFVTFTGGEIFLRPDAIEILHEARRLRLAIRLYTSGTLLGRAEVDQIARLRPVAVELSVYGTTAAVHDRVTRRPGSLRRTLRAAALLRRAGVTVVLKSPALVSTDEAYLGLPALAARLGAGARLDPAVVTRRDGGLEPTAERVGIESITRLLVDHDQRRALDPPPAPSSPLCAIGRRTVRIAPDGLVYPCALYPEPAGDLRQQSFEQIWHHSPVLDEVRRLTLGDLRGRCAGCSQIGYCGRCTALALLEHGDQLGPTQEACGRARARERAAGYGGFGTG